MTTESDLVLAPGRRRSFVNVTMLFASLVTAGLTVVTMSAMIGNFPDVNPHEPFKYVIIGGLFLLVLSVFVFSAANLRTRLVLDAHGLTSYSPFGSRRIAWTEITGCEGESRPRAWVVRVWLDDQPVVVLHRHLFYATNAATTLAPEPHHEVPPNAPKLIRNALAAIRANARAAGQDL